MTPIDKSLLNKWNPENPETVPTPAVLALEHAFWLWRKETLLETGKPADDAAWFENVHPDADPLYFQREYPCMIENACENCPVEWNGCEDLGPMSCENGRSPRLWYKKNLEEYESYERTPDRKKKQEQMRRILLKNLDHGLTLIRRTHLAALYEEKGIGPSEKEIRSALKAYDETKGLDKNAVLSLISVMWRWIAAETIETETVIKKEDWFSHLTDAFPETGLGLTSAYDCYACDYLKNKGKSLGMHIPCTKCPVSWNPGKSNESFADGYPDYPCTCRMSPYYGYMTYCAGKKSGTPLKNFKKAARHALNVAVLADMAKESSENEKGGIPWE